MCHPLNPFNIKDQNAKKKKCRTYIAKLAYCSTFKFWSRLDQVVHTPATSTSTSTSICWTKSKNSKDLAVGTLLNHGREFSLPIVLQLLLSGTHISRCMTN